jgi:CelD/BcsL family acetyltransferase involved in cellulose biosynthesis
LKVAELTFEEFLDSRTVWNDALQTSLDNHIFLTWEWLSNWWRFYGGKRRFLLVTVSDGQKMLAAAPLMSSTYRLYGLDLRKIEFVATPASDYQTFLLTEKKPEYTKIMVEYADHAAREWDCIELREVPENSETLRALRTISREPLRLEERMQNLCPCILLPTAFEDYLRRLGSNWRRNLRRWERKLRQNYKMDFKIHNDIETLNDAMKTFFDLHQKRWQARKQSGAFSDKRFRDFHLDVARSFAERGWLTLNFLTLNDEPVAAGYAFKYAKKLFCYLSGFDPQYSEYEVANLRHIYLIKYCIENGLKEYDFLRGQESYKSRWNSFMRRNLEVRAIKRKIVPIVYDWITKTEELSLLTYRLGEHLSLR